MVAVVIPQRTGRLICLTGKSSRSADSRRPARFAKIFLFSSEPKSLLELASSRPTEWRSANVTDVGLAFVASLNYNVLRGSTVSP
jgi:hypothetical protein